MTDGQEQGAFPVGTAPPGPGRIHPVCFSSILNGPESANMPRVIAPPAPRRRRSGRIPRWLYKGKGHPSTRQDGFNGSLEHLHIVGFQPSQNPLNSWMPPLLSLRPRFLSKTKIRYPHLLIPCRARTPGRPDCTSSHSTVTLSTYL
jgi:hypothetical protein